MKKQIIICLSALLTASSCSMLELDESTGMSKFLQYFREMRNLHLPGTSLQYYY